ncbi:MAG: hypothetical protein HC933_12995 [Pleurocapsa sp. SU_196_0]|nr:hypothetical protein [Pleurocapsa sp. SU_196_0]
MRLLNELDDAMVALTRALNEYEDVLDLHADFAVARLQCDDDRGALESLRVLEDSRADLKSAERDRVTVARAELRRRSGDFAGAMALLSTLDEGRLWVLEEQVCFPDLFKLVGVPRRSLHPMRVRVNLDGGVRVFMNEHLEVKKCTPRAASLLAFMVCHGNAARDEALMDGLGEDGGVSKKQLYNAADDLRDFLGWREAVQRQSNGFGLDSAVQWLVELPSTERTERFCDGSSDDWVRRWRMAHFDPTLTPV